MMDMNQARDFAVRILELMSWQFDNNKGGCLAQFRLQWDYEAAKAENRSVDD